MLAGVGIDHISALILPDAATAFGIFFLRQFFRTLLATLTFLDSWNNFIRSVAATGLAGT